MSDGPTPELVEATCLVCPAQLLAPGRFDVAERPTHDTRYDPAHGYRVNVSTGAPTCVHPYRVGYPPGAYASAREPLPDAPAAPPPDAAALVLPDDPTLLEAWLIAVVCTATPARTASALEWAEATALTRFTTGQVVDSMRRAMSGELTRGRAPST